MSDKNDDRDRPAKAHERPDKTDDGKRRAVRFLQYTSPAMVAMLSSTKAMSQSGPPP